MCQCVGYKCRGLCKGNGYIFVFGSEGIVDDQEYGMARSRKEKETVVEQQYNSNLAGTIIAIITIAAGSGNININNTSNNQ